VPNPYEVDDEGRPVAEAARAPEGTGATALDPAEEVVMRRQIQQTLRAMALSTAIGLVAIIVIAIAVSDIRGVMILVGIVYLASSLAAQWYLRRKFMSRLKGPRPG
jgi:hypothetical protein